LFTAVLFCASVHCPLTVLSPAAAYSPLIVLRPLVGSGIALGPLRVVTTDNGLTILVVVTIRPSGGQLQRPRLGYGVQNARPGLAISGQVGTPALGQATEAPSHWQYALGSMP
jgi:hypothetical protein